MALGTVKWFNAAKRYGFTSQKTGELASSFTSARSRRPARLISRKACGSATS